MQVTIEMLKVFPDNVAGSTKENPLPTPDSAETESIISISKCLDTYIPNPALIAGPKLDTH